MHIVHPNLSKCLFLHRHNTYKCNCIMQILSIFGENKVNVVFQSKIGKVI